jgi:hypothetical protein
MEMDYLSRKSLSKYLMDMIDFIRHDINNFINDMWQKYRATLQNYKATSLPEWSANVSPGIQVILMKLKAIMSRKNFTSRYPWKRPI